MNHAALPEMVTLRQLRLAGVLPDNRGSAARAAKRKGWQLVRVRGNGGLQYAVHRDELSDADRIAFLRENMGVADAAATDAELWRRFNEAPHNVQAGAKRRLNLLNAVESRQDAGQSLYAATNEVAAEHGVSVGTIRRIVKIVRDVPRCDRLPALAKRYRGAAPNENAVSPEAWRYFLTCIARSSAPRPLKACFDDTAEAAELNGWAWPTYVTVWKRWRALPAGVKAKLRSGPKAQAKTIPPQQRLVAHLSSMQIVNLDGRRLDIVTCWEDRTVSRPTILTIQDVYSRKVLGWLLVKTEDSDSTKALLLYVTNKYGRFDVLLTDNSRAFSSNKIAGGAKTRYRWRKTVGVALGILKRLGIEVRFATPRHGQAKPVERSFRDQSQRIDTLPEFKDAYCGNRPDAKPEDFTGTPVDIATVREVYGREIDAHNARPGRRTEMCKGKFSFNEVFAESYAKRPAHPITAAQRRFFTLDAIMLTPQKSTGAVVKDGFVYWSPETQDALLKHRERGVRVLFDPTDRSKPVMVEDINGRVIAESVPCMRPGKFDSTEDARTWARERGRMKKADRHRIDALNLMGKTEFEALRKRAHAARPEPQPPAPQTNVTRPKFGALPGKPVSAVGSGKIGSDSFQESAARGIAKLKERKREAG